MAKNYTNGQKKSTTTSESTTTEPSYYEVFARHEPIYDLFEKTGELVNFHPHVRAEVVAAYQLAHPHYSYNDGCAACISEMITTIYRWYKSVKQ